MSEKTDDQGQTVEQTQNSIAEIEKNKEKIQKRIAEILKGYSEELLHEELEKISDEFVDSLPEKLKDYAEEKSEEGEVKEPISKLLRKDKLLPF